jgi:hypothetical protein
MITFEDISIYLPKYLSEESTKSLFDTLKQFPENIDQRLYTRALKGSQIIYQGDGIKDVLFVDLPSQKCKKVNGFVLSNTCDIDPNNERYRTQNIIYTPIISINNYITLLRKNKIPDQKIDDHIEALKKQQITNIFYLPKTTILKEEFIIFFDRVNSCDMSYFCESNIDNIRLFSLSNYGLYIFLFKLSIHFTRIREGVDRVQIGADN